MTKKKIPAEVKVAKALLWLNRNPRKRKYLRCKESGWFIREDAMTACEKTGNRMSGIALNGARTGWEVFRDFAELDIFLGAIEIVPARELSERRIPRKLKEGEVFRIKEKLLDFLEVVVDEGGFNCE